MASIGVRYFPGDGSLLYYLGLARMRLGQFDAAERCLQDAIAAAPDMVAARTVLAVRWLTTGRHSDAAAILSLPDGVEPDDRRAAAEASRLRQWVMWRRMMLGWAGVLLVAATAVSLMFGWVGAIVGAAGVAILAVGWFAFQRQLDAVASRQHFEEIGQGLRRIHRAERRGAPIS